MSRCGGRQAEGQGENEMRISDGFAWCAIHVLRACCAGLGWAGAGEGGAGGHVGAGGAEVPGGSLVRSV